MTCEKCSKFKIRLELFDGAMKSVSPKVMTQFTCDTCFDQFSQYIFPETLKAFEEAGKMQELPRLVKKPPE